MSLNELKTTLAQALNEDESAIRATNPKWLELMREGVLVSVHIGRWRAKTRLTWSDLGIELDEEADRELENIINLGHKKLLPAAVLKELDAIESAARKWLEKKSFRTYWGFFIPVTAYDEWKAKNEEYRARYFAARDDLVRDYDEIVGNLIYGYRMAAKAAYNRLKVLHPEKLEKFRTEGAFADAFTQGIEAHLWDAAAIRESFRFEIELRYVPLPSLLAEEDAERQRLEDVVASARQAADHERHLEEARFQAEREKVWEEARAARNAAAWKEQLMRDMHKDVVSQARKQKEKLVNGFLTDLVKQLRGIVYEASVDVLAAIQKNAALPPRSVVQLTNLVSQVKSLNFYGDTEIEQMIAPIAAQLDREAADRDLSQIEATLQDSAVSLRASLISLGERPRAARDLGIRDVPLEAEVERARRSRRLRLDGEAPVAALVREGARVL